MDTEREAALTHLRDINEYEFEHFVADLLEQYGWKTSVTSGSNDRGVDIIAEKTEPFQQMYFIQAKCWKKNNTVGGPDIRQYSTLRRQQSEVDAVVVVTTSSFSRQAKQEGTDLNVKLIDGSDLYDIIAEVDADDLINEYTDIGSSSNKEESHSCPNCNITTNDKDSLQQHLRDKHGYHVCPNCNKIVEREFFLKNHLRKRHNYISCTDCDEVFKNKRSLHPHLVEKHNYNECTHCDDVFQGRAELQTHLCEKHDYSNCPECDDPFQDRGSLQNHLRKEHWQN
jgi:uncharacterized C2H2 Zn-finger protein